MGLLFPIRSGLAARFAAADEMRLIGTHRSFWWPTRYKLLFLVEWILYAALRCFESPVTVRKYPINLFWPLVFLYGLGCLLVRRSARGMTRVTAAGAVVCILVPILCDQSLKAVAGAAIPLGEHLQVWPGALSFVNVHNASGSWILTGMGANRVLWPVIALLAVLLVLAPGAFRFYVHENRMSFWAFLTFAALFDALACSMIDLVFRGYVLDYIGIPGLVSLDLKDLYALIGVAALFAEIMDNPAVRNAKRGWRAEAIAARSLMVRFVLFLLRGLRRQRVP